MVFLGNSNSSLCGVDVMEPLNKDKIIRKAAKVFPRLTKCVRSIKKNKTFRSFFELYLKKRKRFMVNENEVKQYAFFQVKNKHVFFGYYDLSQFNYDGSKMLVHTVCSQAKPNSHYADIGYFDLTNKGFHIISQTQAWCWQQGARLRWHPLEVSKVLYNDVSDGNYVTKVVDINSNKTEIISAALYDVSNDFMYGVSLNFSRLERLRPGYGYTALTDLTKDDKAPNNDGLFLIELASGEKKLITSLKELAIEHDPNLSSEHYINHVSFCPDGRKFIFFHISVNTEKQSRRKVDLCLYDINTETIDLIESDYNTSHYAWRSGDELLTTVKNKEGGSSYVLYDLSKKLKTVICHKGLKRDGHPSFLHTNSGFISDTYPDESNFQNVFLYDMNKNETFFISEFYHKPVKSSEMRCDLHPRLWCGKGREIITVDTTCKSGLRKIFMMSANAE